MANPVHVVALGIDLDLEKPDLGHPSMPGLWDRLYAQGHGVRVEDRGLQCAGICRDEGVIAWMHLRQRANGRREAVHQHAEDEARHVTHESDEHKAYKERIVRVATEAGHQADTEVRAPGGRIVTDALVSGAYGLRIGWEVQLSSAAASGPRSVRERARKAIARGITPAWHTDRSDYSRRSDTAWTRSDKLPAEVIAKNGDLRVVSGFRVMDFWRCDVRALYPCPVNGWRRCGNAHATPKPRDVLFDDLVRRTAAGLVVPLEYRDGSRTHRFWVPAEDKVRYLGLEDSWQQKIDDPSAPAAGASAAGPTCRPRQRIEVSRTVPVLDWRDRIHYASRPGPCRICGKPAHLLDDEGRHAHKVCIEESA